MSDQKRVRVHNQTPNSEDSVELSASDESEPEEQPSSAPFDPDLDDSDDDGEAEACAPAAAPTAQSTFTLSGGNLAFSYRSRNIFDCLDSVERQTASSLNQGSAADSRKTSHPPPTCPTPPPPKKRGVPDYLVHPERWTHYSLEDVAESSDQDNRRTAHQFLSSLRQEAKIDPPCDIKQRMIFSKPKRPPKEQVAAQESPDLQGKEKELQLSHLEEEEEGREKKETGEQTMEKKEQVEKKEEEDVSGAAGPAEEKKAESSCLSFSSFRKTKMKNYRRSTEQEDE
ncbi:protein TSSC4 [Kryptolebias marmoratus]|uniref:protein TSSC4 n=1 Tax=Kryptolebias marmoratus TaxID=37003 RepID=UPI0007F931A8|nr:protein TSSC4 [Kryptolebias marmoratus]XP_017275084.1 protein TSSC4 [Kryptolebias marmoratus]